MTTKEFVQLEKRLLPNFSGFRIKGPLMFLAPVEHALRGFSFEASAFDKTSFYVTGFFMAVCIPRKHLVFNLGERLRKAGGDRWVANEKNLEVTLRSAMEKYAMLLKQLRTPRDVAEAAMHRGNPQDPYSLETAAYMFALAEEVASAVRALDQLLAMLDIEILWQHEMSVRAQFLKSTILSNPQQAKAQLAIWREQTLRNLRLVD